ncbi:MAG: prolyl oligopeptidase family serine peptidase, partial [Actinomycetota bacterium]
LMAGLQPDDIHRIASASDPRLSPDGTTVAYVVTTIDPEDKDYRSAVWCVASDGSTPPRRITQAAKKAGSPRWAPDGLGLAFVSDRDGKDAQLFVLPADGPGDARPLTDLPEAVESPIWSPDGSSIAFVSREHDTRDDEEDDRKRAPRRITRMRYRLDDEGWLVDRPAHLWVVPADGSGEPVRLTDGEPEDGSPSWSPDGRRLVFVSARHEDWDISPASDLYAIDASGGAPELLTSTDGGCSCPSWSPDGTRIAYLFTPGLWDEPRHAQVAVLDLATGSRKLLTESLDRNCGPYPSIREVLWDGERLVFAVEDAGNTLIFRVAADGSGEPEPLLGSPRSVTGYDVGPGGMVASTESRPEHPAEVFVGERRLSRHTDDLVGSVELSAPEAFTAISADGTEVPAWIMRPTGAVEGPVPAILNIHGGPFTQYGTRFFDEFQVQAAAGYAVIFANPRGGSGYSEEWGRAIRGPVGGPGWGSRDYEDLMAVVDEAVKRFDFIDPDRVAVIGGSYGGYMTSWMVGHTDRFACAISERAVNDLGGLDGTSDFAGFFGGEVGATSWDQPEAYRQVSPLTFAKDITTPLLIIHSEQDLRCSISQAERLFTVLRFLGRDVEFVRFPGEGHELSRSGSPVHREQRFRIILDWLDRHLKV